MAVNGLRTAFENKDMDRIQEILADSSNNITSDPFINTYLEDLLRGIRLNIIITKIKPYRHIKLDYLASELKVPKAEVESLLAELILEERIKGEIDQMAGFLEMGAGETSTVAKHVAM